MRCSTAWIFFYVTPIFSSKLCNNPVALRGQFFSSAASTFKFFMIRLQFSLTHATSTHLVVSCAARIPEAFFCKNGFWYFLNLLFLSFDYRLLKSKLLLRSFGIFSRKSQQKKLDPWLKLLSKGDWSELEKKTKLQTFIVRNLLDQLKSTYITTPSHQIPKIHLISR